ncbi:hypothetical protein ACLB1R_30315 [Escherichia coli]|nr:hypothetical protein [Escherichia coli]MBB0509438.1 hypothetical protein [Escherichia coli]QKM89006.1 hypothetical protein HPE52_19135 [Escherichia coli]HAL1853887.1 hypothetical protein [Escherichia coli]
MRFYFYSQAVDGSGVTR